MSGRRIAAAEDSLARLEWAPDTADEDELEATRAHLRTAHGALVSTKRAKERKLRALKREFQLLREQGRDTPADRRESDGRVARQAELLGQVEEAESTLAAEEQYQYFDAHVPSNAVAGDTILVTAPNGNRPFCFTLPPAAEEDELARHASTAGRVVRVRMPKQ